MEKRIEHLMSENDGLSATNLDRLKELDALRLKNIQLEERIRNESNDLRSQVEELKAGNHVNNHLNKFILMISFVKGRKATRN